MAFITLVEKTNRGSVSMSDFCSVEF